MPDAPRNDPSRGTKNPQQTKHADKIRTERALMDLTGVSRAQLREGFAQLREQIVRAPDPPAAPPPAQAPAPLQTDTVAFQAQPLTLGGAPNRAPQAVRPDPTTIRVTLAVLGSDQVWYGINATINGEFETTVP